MPGLARACGLDGAISGAISGRHLRATSGAISGAEAAMKEVEGEAVKAQGKLGVVASAFVAHKGVGTVDLDPGVPGLDLVEACVNLHAAFEGDVRILTTPDHEELALDVFGALERVVVGTFTKAAPVDVGGVEADGSAEVGVHGGAEGEVAADADAHCAEFAGTVGAGLEVIECGAGIGVVARELLGGLPLISAIRAGLIVGEDGAGGFELVVDLGHGDDVAVAREHGGGAADGAGDLKDLRVEDDAGIFAGGGGAEDVGAHGTKGSREFYLLVIEDDHCWAPGGYSSVEFRRYWLRSARVYGGLMLVTLAAGLLLRFAPLGMPAFVVKYGGSTMWALMIYWVVAVVGQRWRVGKVMVVAGVAATGVEFLKLYRVPWLDAFRMTLPGVLLLGRYFAWSDIAAYWVAIGVGAVADNAWIRRTELSPDMPATKRR